MVHGPPTGDSWSNRNTSVVFYILEVTSRNVHESLEILLNADSDSVDLGCGLNILHFSQAPR